MKYRIIGEVMPAVEVIFDAPGESMYTQSGGMAWMTDGVEMKTNAKGGVMKGLGNIMFGGEGLFLTKLVGPGRIILQTQNIAEFAGRIARFIPTGK